MGASFLGSSGRRHKLATAHPSGLDTPSRIGATFLNVPIEALGWCPLATPEPISVALGVECSDWPEPGHMPTLPINVILGVKHSKRPNLGHMPALNQSVWPWGWKTLFGHTWVMYLL